MKISIFLTIFLAIFQCSNEVRYACYESRVIDNALILCNEYMGTEDEAGIIKEKWCNGIQAASTQVGGDPNSVSSVTFKTEECESENRIGICNLTIENDSAKIYFYEPWLQYNTIADASNRCTLRNGNFSQP